MKRIIFLIGWIIMSQTLTAQNKESVYETASMKIVINEKGLVKSFYDKLSGVNYLFSQKSVPILNIRCDGKVEAPSSMKTKANLLVFSFDKSAVEAKVKVINQKSYITFELVDISPSNKVELIIWGPYSTTIKETIGETVGVVHNDKFAIGIQALNYKTLGGYPSEESDVEPSIDVTDSLYINSREPWKVQKTYRGQTAKVESYGSVIQAYCRNRNKERIISNWSHDYYVAPPFNDGGVIGSKIALFGCSPKHVLEVISQIEVKEGLPHPIIDGKWGKISPSATASYLIIDFDENTLNEALELTERAGLKYLYQSEPFETWGHFKFIGKYFPDNWESMKRCVEKAERQGIHLGVHTLSNFITTNDPYVTPLPDKRLARVGTSVLTTAIDSKATEIPVESPMFFNQMKNNNLRSVVIGDEIIRYNEVSASAPWKLTGCVRGAFNTKASAHQKDEVIGKLMDHGYKTFLTNSELSGEVAGRLADLFNYTGLRQTSFDGLEGNFSTGMGQYGCQLFVKTWYDKLNPKLKGMVINDASMPGHFNWHINTRYNWGEPWYAGFRESQTQLRLKNQDYFRRNFLPSMLGWFKMTAETSIEDVEWLLARAAGFDAGFSFCVNLNTVNKNNQRDTILKAISTWETARMSQAFTPEQKLKMEDINNEYHLENAGAGIWNLYPYAIKRYVHEQKVRQPGEPLFSTFEFENPYNTQPVIFTMNLLSGEKSNGSSIEKISLEINNNNKIEIPVNMEPFQILKSDGKGNLQVFDKNWKMIKRIDFDGKALLLSQGKNTIIFDAVFNGESSSKLKIEMKTIGNAEPVKATTKNNE